jgi:iron complex transport system substrate-binding protein
MKRTLAAWVALLALVLGACATDSGPSESATDNASEAGEAFPVTIDHRYGSTSVPSAPRRVVSVGFTDHDYLLALGVTPVAVRDWFGDQPLAIWPWAQDALGDAKPEMLSSGDLNYEVIAGLRPDLIVGIYSGLTEEEYGKLSQIAPTVAQTKDDPDFGAPWQEQTRMIGRAVGREDKAVTLVDKVEARFESVKDQFPQFEGKTAAIGYSFEAGSFGSYGSSDPRSRTMAALGFEIPEEIDRMAGDAFFTEISAEQLNLLDADVLLWVLTVPAEVVTGSPVYQQLDVAKEGRDVFLDDVLAGAFSFSSPLSLPYLLDRLAPQLAAAVDGDPATSPSPAPSPS